MTILESYKVEETLDSPVRLSDFAGGKFQLIPSRKGMKKAIDKGLVTVDGQVANTGDWIKGGELIELFESEITSRPNIELDLKILFEDEHLAVVLKPAGIEVSGSRKRTLENALSGNLNLSSEPDGLKYSQATHRLDYPTSGVVLIGKTRSAVSALNRLFEERQIEKVYHAVCIGKIDTEGTINQSIDGKPSISHFKTIQQLKSEKYGGLNLLELKPITGRRHQLRKHLSSIGNPILGDKEYGSEGKMMTGNGLFLHASSLQFTHPVSQKVIYVKAELPKKFLKLFPDA